MNLRLKSNQKDIKILLKVNDFANNENITFNDKSYIFNYTIYYLSKSINKIKLIEFEDANSNNITIYKILPNDMFNPENILKYYIDNKRSAKCLFYKKYMFLTFKDKTEFISYLLFLSSKEKIDYVKKMDN